MAQEEPTLVWRESSERITVIEFHQPNFMYKREMSEADAAGGGEGAAEGGQEADSYDSHSDGKAKSDKITILLKATANAPIAKKRKWLVEPDKSVASINQFVRKLLHLDENASLFLYVNQSFAPSPDQTIRNLYNCFETDGKLILHYCTTQAWG